MRRYLLVFVLLFLALPASADKADEFFARCQAFDKVVDKAEKVEQIFPHITAKSVAEIKAKSADDQAKILSYLQVGVAMSPDGMKVLESKIGSEQAALTIGAEEDGMTVSREVEFRKEDGKWKVELLAFLDKLQ